ncbi:hypothetical protein [Chromobacterium subtsugae]|uniref:hypothetical protein n=1 Tax=Chromobacterium subtsugae TaxID=251747 RepID=UPI000640E944|nr:hypothetical protein [Chromobacterium subtsugae]
MISLTQHPDGQAAPALDFNGLRRYGIEAAQHASGELWTDYNHHDPGVTLLEALCYALTESVYAAGHDVADLLTAPDGRIHYRRHALHRAEDVLHCRPSTRLDLMRYLLDRVPLIRHLRLDMPQADGLWRLALRAPAGAARQAAAQAASAYWAQRNLAEDLAMPPQVLQPRWCSLQIELNVEGARELTDILLELVRRCSAWVAGQPARQPARERLDEVGVEGVDGPWLNHGWIRDEALHDHSASRLYFSDLKRELVQVEGVVGIDRLRLVAEDSDDDAIDSLAWYGDDWALQLRWPVSADALTQWVIRRGGNRQNINRAALLSRLADALQAERTAQLHGAAGSRGERLYTAPTGHYLPPRRYLSCWHDLPPLYREAHSVSRGGREIAGQFAAYLALLEQWVAHGDAQRQHLRSLFSLESAPARSYWWELLGADHLPELAASGQDAARQLGVLEAGDDALSRRSRVLDLLLALHGDSCAQNSIQRFGWYFAPEEWRARLYECKRLLLRRIVRHTRDRGGAFDYSRPSLGRRGNTAAVQERICLQLGFTRIHSRLLLDELTRRGLALNEPARAPEGAAQDGLRSLAMWTPLRSRVDILQRRDLAQKRLASRLTHSFPGLDAKALPAALLRCAVHADRYHAAADEEHPLWLGPDERGGWWPLAVDGGSKNTQAAAMYLHLLACKVQRDAEGLHLVEHVLLRPQGGDALHGPPDVPADFYPNRVSVVFAGWTARTADGSFRSLAEDSLGHVCPAHVLPAAHWLSAAELGVFERLFQSWLDARRAWCEGWQRDGALGDEEAAAELERSAAPLRRLLWHRARVVGGGRRA